MFEKEKGREVRPVGGGEGRKNYFTSSVLLLASAF